MDGFQRYAHKNSALHLATNTCCGIGPADSGVLARFPAYYIHWYLNMESKKDKCSGEECYLCSSKISGRHHAHPQKWSGELFKFLNEVTTI